MNQNINNSLIKKFMNGECSKEEQYLLNNYFETSEGKKHLDEFLKSTWSSNQGELNDLQLVKHKEEFFQKIKSIENNDEPIQETRIHQFKKSNLKKLYYSISAAIILTLIGLSIYNYKENSTLEDSNDINWLVFENNTLNNDSLLLPDNSKVILGPKSKLTYQKDFKGEFREVNLEGEGYFDVQKDSTKRFIIHSGNYQTSVLGTSFLLKSDKHNNFKLLVTSGRVLVDHKVSNGKLETLGKFSAGDRMQFINQSGEIIKNKFDPIEVSNWKIGITSFDSQPLSTIIEMLERNYDKKIRVKNSDLLDVSITIQISNGDKLADILDVISISLGVHYEDIGEEIIIE